MSLQRAVHIAVWKRLLLSALVLFTACGTDGQLTPSPSAPADTRSAPRDTRTELYFGPLPEPAALPPTPLPGGPDYSAEAPAWVDALVALGEQARGGGVEAVAAWQSLLVASGVPVIDETGKPVELNGQTGAGYAVDPVELRLLASLAAAPGGLSLSELGYALEGIPGLAGSGLGADLTTAFVESWQVQTREAESAKVALRALASTGPSGRFIGDQTDPDDFFLSWAQIGFLLRLLVSEAVLVGAEMYAPGVSEGQSVVTLAVATSRSDHTRSLAESRDPCAPADPVAKVVISKTFQLRDLLFGKILDKVTKAVELELAKKALELPAHIQKTQRFLKALGIAGAVANFGSLLARASALQARFDLSDPPLVRTKDIHPGEVRDVRVTLSVDRRQYEAVTNCLNLMLAAGGVGVQLPVPEGGPAADLEVELSTEDPATLRVGDGSGSGPPATSRTTDAQGVAAFMVSGAPQPQKIPDRAAPLDVEVVLRALTNIENKGLWKDLFVIDVAVEAAQPTPWGIATTLLARTRWLTFYGSVQVRDWTLNAEFEATLDAELVSHRAQDVLVVGCGADFRTAISHDDKAAITSDPVHVDAVLLKNPEGNLTDQAVVFTPHGEPFSLRGIEWPLLFQLPAHFSVTSVERDPAEGELPPQEQLAVSDCVGGGGGGDPVDLNCDAAWAFDAELALAVPRPRALLPAATGQQTEPDPYPRCGSVHDVLPPSELYAWECQESMTLSGGTFPSVEDVFDDSRDRIEISGSASCRDVQSGHLVDIRYDWTLRLCRIRNGVPAC